MESGKLAKARLRPEDLATPEAFRGDPRTVWDWYAARGAGFILITQNVDGLHHASGSRGVVELHGNIRRAKCFEGVQP